VILTYPNGRGQRLQRLAAPMIAVSRGKNLCYQIRCRIAKVYSLPAKAAILEILEAN
jgi:hypothetical protein